MKYYIDGKKQGQVGYAIRSAFLEWWDTTNLPPAASVRSITFAEGFTAFGGVGAGSPVREGGEVEPPRTAAGGTLSGPGAALTALALTEQS